MTNMKNSDITKCKVAKKLDHSYIAGGHITWYSQFGKHFGSFLKKLNTPLTNCPAIALLGIYPREMTIYIDTQTCAQMFIAAFFHNSQKLETQRSFNRWTVKPCHIHTMEYYQSIKRNKLLIHRVTWINLWGKKPITKSCTLYDFTYMTLLTIYRDREQASGCQGSGMGDMVEGGSKLGQKQPHEGSLWCWSYSVSWSWW